MMYNRVSLRRQPRRPRRRGRWGIGPVLLIILPLLVAAAFYLALQAQARIEELTEQLDPIFVTPIPIPSTPQPTPDALKEPLNILLLGLDQRRGDLPCVPTWHRPATRKDAPVERLSGQRLSGERLLVI